MGDRILDEDDERYLEDLAIPARDPVPDIDGDCPDVRKDSFMYGDDNRKFFTLEKVPRGQKFGNTDYDPDTPLDVYAMMAVCFIFAIIYQIIKLMREKKEVK